MSDENKDVTLQRCPHDKANPYTMINTDLIRDERLSPECRWLLVFLLSNKDGWVINTAQIMAHLKPHKGYGRNNVRAIFKEAIDAGYMRRVDYLDNGLTRYKYYVSEFPKNVSDEPNHGAPNFGRPQKGSLKKEHSSSLHSEERKNISICTKPQKENKSATPPSAEAENIYKFFLENLRKENPGFKEPNAEKWKKELDLMLRKDLDNRDLEMTKILIEWACKDDHWSGRCLSPGNLRDNYDAMFIQMRNQKKNDTKFINRAYALAFYQANREDMPGFVFNSKCVVNSQNAKDVEFSMPHEQFKERLEYIFGD